MCSKPTPRSECEPRPDEVKRLREMELDTLEGEVS